MVNLLPKEYLDMIRPYLSDIINDYKTPKKSRVHSHSELTDYKIYQYGEWKIQLTMLISFIFLKILMRPVIYIQKVII